MQVPFVVNEEVETAREFVLAGVAFSCPYEDVIQLVNLLETLSHDRSSLDEARNALKKMARKYPLYEEQIKPLMDTIQSLR